MDDDHPFVHSTFEFSYDAEQDIARYASMRQDALARMVPDDERSAQAFRRADCMWRCAVDVVESPEYCAYARVVAVRRDRAEWQERLVGEATAALDDDQLGRRVGLRTLPRRMNVGLNRLALARLEPVAVRLVPQLLLLAPQDNNKQEQQAEDMACLGRFLSYMDGHTLEEALVLVGPGDGRVVPTQHLFVYY